MISRVVIDSPQIISLFGIQEVFIRLVKKPVPVIGLRKIDYCVVYNQDAPRHGAWFLRSV
jgi:hypothetical protein